jgi:aldose 1-epimerase
VECFTLTNANGVCARLINWGATLTQLHAPDRSGTLLDVTLGFDQPERWFQEHPFFGTIAGRYANRIALGRFTLDGVSYQLPVNNGPNTLHGGIRGFDKYVWGAEALPGKNAVRFTHVSADGSEGFPGELRLELVYTLTDSNELQLDYTAVTSKPTVLNVTNHTYWNLSGEPQILDHVLRLNATRFAAVNAMSIPIGELVPATGPWDFTNAKPIGRDIGQVQDQPGGGYDHSWAIEGWTDVSRIPGADLATALKLAAELHDPESGRFMEVFTTEPGVQFYTGNYLDGVPGKSGKVYPRHGGLCLETNHFADSPNQPKFPTTILRPGETFRSRTIYKFSVK